VIDRMSKSTHGHEPQLLQALHPAWLALIRHCRDMGHGEIERLKIQDGIPVMVEKSIQRIKLA
jgi:hypothetical protein